MRFTVGELIYLLSNEKKHLFPVQIVEEIRRKTLDDEIVSYNIRLPDTKQTVVPLSEVTGDVFTDLAEAREDMVKHATGLIDKIVEQSAILSETFGVISEESSPTENEEDSGILSADQDIVEVDLGNGVMGKVNISGIGV
mgnify:CR=1 FL=1|jgi:hypothetical protein|tara:strand:- start:147 stop:566 length:420 start_codon:yes stop_codon:yes gene_type:complete